jgi:hypothetical protein
MLQLITNYVLIGIAVLIPVLFLAGVVWVLVRPLSLEDVERRHRERHGAGEPPAGSGAGSGAGAGTGSGTGTGGREGDSRRRPRRPGRAA